MPAVNKEIIRKFPKRGIAPAVKEAQQQVSEPLPTLLYVELEAFGQHGKELSLGEVIPFLFRDGTFPKVVDIAVRGIKDERTFIWIRPSGHEYVSDFSQTWNTPAGRGPFNSVGLMMPASIWERSRPFSPQDLKGAGGLW